MSDTNRPYGGDDGSQERAQKFIAGIPYAHNHSVKSCRACAGEMAEIAILRARVAELEAELAKRPSASGGDEARRSSPTDVTNVGCERCGGSGKWTGSLSYAQDDNCPACGGSGKPATGACERCGGTGVMECLCGFPGCTRGCRGCGGTGKRGGRGYMRRGITFGGEAFYRPAMWLGDRLQFVWLGWRRWSWGAFHRVREPIPFVWQGFVGPVEIRWWVKRGGRGT